MPWGFKDSDWLNGTAEMTKILRQTAASRAMISYLELAKKIQSVTLDYHSAAMDNMLLEVSRKEWEQGNGLLSVLVVHKYGDMEPGNGFYGLAETLGLDTSDRLRLWVGELHRVHDRWSNKGK